MKRALALLLFVVLLASSAYAAQWVGPLEKKYSWDKKEWGFCPDQSQCLVSARPDAEQEYNGEPSRYFTDPPGPRCINNTQFILDYYCENGAWTTRTKLVGLSLLDLANIKSNDFVVFCGTYKDALNKYQYLIGSDRKLVEDLFKDFRCRQFDTSTRTACVNSFCVVKYKGGTGVGTSLNTVIDDEDYSFLYALNGSEDDCDNVPESDDVLDWQSCTGWNKAGRLFYNPAIGAVVYLASSDSLNINSYGSAYDRFISPQLTPLRNYVRTGIEDPDVPALNFSFFAQAGLFNQWYYSRQQNKYVFGFLEEDQTEFGYDYLGIKYSGYDFVSSDCDVVFKQYGESHKGRGVFCDQAGNDLFVVAKGARNSESPLVGAWQGLTSKLRPK